MSEDIEQHINKAPEVNFPALAGSIVRQVGPKGIRCTCWRPDTIRCRLPQLAGLAGKCLAHATPGAGTSGIGDCEPPAVEARAADQHV